MIDARLEKHKFGLNHSQGTRIKEMKQGPTKVRRDVLIRESDVVPTAFGP
jgi:hypothetical protein